MHAIDLTTAFASFRDHWQPRIATTVNGHAIKLVKVQGEFPWHHHDEAEELFFVWRGRLRLEFRDRVVELTPGQFCLVPQGVEHRPVADDEVEMLLFEPAGLVNTGNLVGSDRTAVPKTL